MQIQTKRLTIRPVLKESLPTLCRLLTDPKVTEFYMVPDFENENHVVFLAQRLMEISNQPNRILLGIYLGEDLIGIVNEMDTQDDFMELGWALLPEYHHCGYGSEMLTAVMDALFAQGVPQIVAGAFAENQSSIRMMIRCGMTQIEREEEISYRGKVHCCFYFHKEKKTR